MCWCVIFSYRHYAPPSVTATPLRLCMFSDVFAAKDPGRLRESHYPRRNRGELNRKIDEFVSARLPEQILQYEDRICRPLGQAAHEVGIPLRAEGNINAAAPAFFD